MSGYIAYKGTYNPAAKYARYDMVIYNNQAYFASLAVSAYVLPPTYPWVAFSGSSATLSSRVDAMASSLSGIRLSTASNTSNIEQILIDNRRQDTSLTDARTRLTAVESTNTQQSTNISSLQAANASLATRLLAAEALNTQQSTTITALQASVRTLQTQMTQVLASFQQLGLTDTTLTLTPSGGNIALSALLTKMLNVQINILPSLPEMALRSLFGTLLSRMSGLESNVADISGVRLASEEAKSALNDIHDAMQDVSGALLQLKVATAQSDLSGVLVRLADLEAAPGFDPAGVNAVITDLSGNLAYYKSTNDAAVSAAASAASAAQSAADAAASAASTAASAASAAQSTADTKVAQSDYNAFVIATNTSLDSKALASDLTTGLAAKADASAVALKEDIGRIHKIDMVTTDVSGVNPAYWLGSLSSVIGAIVVEGKVAELVFAEGNPLSHFLDAANEVAVGTAFRFKNSGNQEWGINLGSGAAPGPAIAIAVGETMTVVKVGVQAWKVL